MTATAYQFIAVAAGGALGALARYAVSLGFAAYPGRLYFGTLLANVLGSLLIGVAYVLIVEKGLLPPVARQLVMVGFLGAFTTFSTFALEALALMTGGHWLAALGYVAASLLASLLAVAAGFYGGQWLT